VLTLEEHTVVEHCGSGRTMEGTPSTPGPEIFSLELRLSYS
jgi:hypothetical protein